MKFAVYPSLEGKSVLVTGGASGIGADIVRGFAGQGAKVGFLDIDADASARLSREVGETATFETCDLRDIEALRAAVSALRDRLGPFAVLVNNAARDDRHDWTKVDADYWDERMFTNLRHMFFAIQAVAPDMIAGGGDDLAVLALEARSTGDFSKLPPGLNIEIHRILVREAGRDPVHARAGR